MHTECKQLFTLPGIGKHPPTEEAILVKLPYHALHKIVNMHPVVVHTARPENEDCVRGMRRLHHMGMFLSSPFQQALYQAPPHCL